MKIAKGKFPPNYNEIKNSLGEHKSVVYCYGDTLYAPYESENSEIPQDILIHEEVHVAQQGEYVTPEYWWARYVSDKAFRKEQEAEAFKAQYQWVKERVTNKTAKECLFDLASILSSSLYNLGIGYQESEQLIRK